MAYRQYYIIDTFENYYKLNETGHLVVAPCREEATMLSLGKANNVLSNMVKPNQRNKYILVETSGEDRVCEEISRADYKETDFDGLDTDWEETLRYTIRTCKQLRQYRVNLNCMLSEVDKEICDIMHYIEFYNLDAASGYRVYKMLKERRERRRQIKDEHERVNYMISAFGNAEFLQRMEQSLEQIHQMENRYYRPRVLEELFVKVS